MITSLLFFIVFKATLVSSTFLVHLIKIIPRLSNPTEQLEVSAHYFQHRFQGVVLLYMPLISSQIDNGEHQENWIEFPPQTPSELNYARRDEKSSRNQPIKINKNIFYHISSQNSSSHAPFSVQPLLFNILPVSSAHCNPQHQVCVILTWLLSTGSCDDSQVVLWSLATFSGRIFQFLRPLL